MKKISAMIQSGKVDDLLEAMISKSKIYCLTITETKGFEQLSHIKEIDLIDEKIFHVVEFIINDTDLELIHDIIVETCHTGLVGDGRIVVVPVESAFRISTKEYY